MSRKRKRRGRGSASETDAMQDNKSDYPDDGIEIVDDVNLLGDVVASADDAKAAAPAGKPPVAETVADASEPAVDQVAPSNTVAIEVTGATDAVDPVDAAAIPKDHPDSEDPSSQQPQVAAVHVVDSLDESPVADEGDRNVETLGELLQHAREAKGLSLEEVSARTRIALLTLKNLESDRFGELPAEAYVKGFLRSYGSFLSLDVSMLLRRYEKLSGNVSTPVAEIWDEVEVENSGLKLWRPGTRTVVIGGGVLVVVALAWVFWSQGAVMLGLRPEGELQQMEMQLQRDARDGSTPQTSITGLDDASLQQDPEDVKPVDGEKDPAGGVGAKNPPSNAGPSTVGPQSPGAANVTVEDTSPPVPQPPLKPAHKVKPAAQPTTPVSSTTKPAPKKTPTSSVAPPVAKPSPAAADKKAVAKPVKKTVKKPVRKPVAKPVKKPAPAPSPEDAAGPPA